MPVYSYQCEDEGCKNDFDLTLPMSSYAEAQNCPECSHSSKRLVTSVGFVLKGDGWTGKNLRIKKQMALKNRRLDTKQNEMKRDAPAMTLAPNVNGERVETWDEAKRLAESKGKETSTYDSYVRKEKAALA